MSQWDVGTLQDFRFPAEMPSQVEDSHHHRSARIEGKQAELAATGQNFEEVAAGRGPRSDCQEVVLLR
jgi:hypothetical protein